MNNEIKICIADDNEDVAKNIATSLSLNPRISVIDVCKNGKETIEVIQNKKIDVLLIDIIMPEVDGIGVIEEIDKEINNGTLDKRPNIIIVSAIVHDNLRFNILNKGVNYYMTKPIDFDTLEKRIIEIYDYENNNEHISNIISNNTTKILYQIGIYPNLNGYKYIKRAIELLVKQPKINKDFRKNIYTILAKEDKTEVEKVEKSIINALNVSWHKEKENVVQILKNTKYNKRKPSTNILLSAIAEEIINIDEIKNNKAI